MVDPPPRNGAAPDPVTDKAALRRRLRAARRDHVATLPDVVRALVFSRPPAPVARMVPHGATVGLYHAVNGEAPTRGYASWFHENGFALALPWFGDRKSAMSFREWRNPFDEDGLVSGPFASQPSATSKAVTPDVVFVPLLGFTTRGARLGQGGGHYDRWLAEHPDIPAIGLAWDCQKLDTLPIEPHDRHLALVVTPTTIHAGSD